MVHYQNISYYFFFIIIIIIKKVVDDMMNDDVNVMRCCGEAACDRHGNAQ